MNPQSLDYIIGFAQGLAEQSTNTKMGEVLNKLVRLLEEYKEQEK